MKNQWTQKSLSFLLSAIMLLGLTQGLTISASAQNSASMSALGGSNIEIMLDNVEGGYLQVSTLDSSSNRKYVPIGMSVQIPLDNNKVELDITPLSYSYKGLDSTDIIVCTDVEVKTLNGKLLDTIISKNLNKYGAIKSIRYSIEESVTITGKFEFVSRINTPNNNYSSESFDIDYKYPKDFENLWEGLNINKGESVNIDFQLATFYTNDKTLPVEVFGFTYNKVNPLDPMWDIFELSPSGRVTSLSPISTPGEYYISVQATRADGTETSSSWFYIKIGSHLGYRYYMLDRISSRLSYFHNTQYGYKDSTLAELNSSSNVMTDVFYGLIFDGWYTPNGLKINDSDKILQDGSNTAIARYKDSSGKIYSVSPLKIGGGVIDFPTIEFGDGIITIIKDPNDVLATSVISSSSVSSSSDGKSSNKVDISTNLTGKIPQETLTANPTNIVNSKTVDEKTALEALAKAIKAGTPVTFKNPESITLETLKAMVAKAGGKDVVINADTFGANGTVDVRIKLNAKEIKSNVGLKASTQSAKSNSIVAIFNKYYKNTTTVLSTNQVEDFNVAVEYAVKIDPTLNTKNLVFYTYNSTTNTFARFIPLKYWIDTKGYLHFTTAKAGNIVITDKVLEKK